MTALDAWTALSAAVYGRAPDEPTRRLIGEAVGLPGEGPGDFPAYLRTLAGDLAAARTRPPTPVPQAERGYAWLLRELLPAFPGAELIDDDRRDVFVPPGLGVAAVVTREDPETWAVIPWPESASAGAGELIVLDTFNPTPEQVRQWAYAPHLRLAAQDEHLAVMHRACLPLLVECAADPACPKRGYLLTLADGLVASVGSGPYDRDLIDHARALVDESAPEDVRAWARDLAWLREYVDGQGPVSAEEADRLVEVAFRGRYRPSVRVSRAERGDWWEFTAALPGGDAIDRLYVARSSGALVWSRESLTEALLVPHASPARRDDPLGRAPGSR